MLNYEKTAFMTLDIKEKEVSPERGFSQLTALSFPDAALGRGPRQRQEDFLNREDGDQGTTVCNAEHWRGERGTNSVQLDLVF